MDLAADRLRQLLQELAEWLAHEQCPPAEWVVCGGTALALQGLRARTTQDVDILGCWRPADATIKCIETIPDDVTQCIKRVIAAHPELHGLNTRWINLGPQQLTRWGLPSAFETRLTQQQFGTHLTLHLLDRVDLIALKLFAAADDLGTRQTVHLADLRALNPTYSELDSGVDWIKTLPDYEVRQSTLRDALNELGHEDLAYYV